MIEVSATVALVAILVAVWYRERTKATKETKDKTD